jgi:hypothetical protein
MRTPSAVVGVADVYLMFLVARRIFRTQARPGPGVAILAPTPAHFMHSGSQQIGAVLFVLLWLLFFLR